MDITTAQKLSYGVYVVSAWHDGKAAGCIANAVMQVTADPPTLAVSINRDNYTNECIKGTGKFAVSILAEDCDPSVIGTFGFKSGRTVDKFASVKSLVEANMPVLADSCGYLVCDLKDAMETSTHTVFLGEITDCAKLGDRKPMTYDYYHNVIKGKSPKTAPTYVEEAAAPEQKRVRKFRCKLCGYVYEGESLPPDIACPICGVGADEFEEMAG
ncbi:MAG: flavin reductase [Roseburia sp.]|nr:flavin reductase [Roseburia sp.]